MDPVDRDRQRFGRGVFGKEYELRVFGPRRNVLVSWDPLSVQASRHRDGVVCYVRGVVRGGSLFRDGGLWPSDHTAHRKAPRGKGCDEVGVRNKCNSRGHDKIN